MNLSKDQKMLILVVGAIVVFLVMTGKGKGKGKGKGSKSFKMPTLPKFLEKYGAVLIAVALVIFLLCMRNNNVVEGQANDACDTANHAQACLAPRGGIEQRREVPETLKCVWKPNSGATTAVDGTCIDIAQGGTQLPDGSYTPIVVPAVDDPAPSVFVTLGEVKVQGPGTIAMLSTDLTVGSGVSGVQESCKGGTCKSGFSCNTTDDSGVMRETCTRDMCTVGNEDEWYTAHDSEQAQGNLWTNASNQCRTSGCWWVQDTARTGEGTDYAEAYDKPGKCVTQQNGCVMKGLGQAITDVSGDPDDGKCGPSQGTAANVNFLQGDNKGCNSITDQNTCQIMSNAGVCKVATKGDGSFDKCCHLPDPLGAGTTWDDCKI